MTEKEGYRGNSGKRCQLQKRSHLRRLAEFNRQILAKSSHEAIYALSVTLNRNFQVLFSDPDGCHYSLLKDKFQHVRINLFTILDKSESQQRHYPHSPGVRWGKDPFLPEIVSIGLSWLTLLRNSLASLSYWYLLLWMLLHKGSYLYSYPTPHFPMSFLSTLCPTVLSSSFSTCSLNFPPSTHFTRNSVHSWPSFQLYCFHSL